MENKFICRVCMNTFTHKNNFIQHVRLNHEKRNPNAAITSVCNRTSTNRRSFLAHYRSVHERTKKLSSYICNVCNRTCTSRRSFLHHYRNLHERVLKLGIFICNICEIQYTNRGTFLRHFRSVHEKNKAVKPDVFICSVCNQRHTNRRSFLHHYRSFHEKTVKHNVFICNVCNQTYTNRRSFLRHYRFIHERNVSLEAFTCATCNKKFCKKDMLMHHIRQCRSTSDLKTNSYVCAFCYKSFQRKWILRRHLGGHFHRNKEIPHSTVGSMKCVFCKDSFSSVNNIFDHITQHHDVQILHQHMKFTSKGEFDGWKKNMEKSTVTSFRIQRSKQYKQWNIISFVCHRSGSYEVKASNRKRRVKFQGIKKLGAFCPAAITLRINKVDGSCKASYVSTHLGHNIFDKTELVHIDIPKEERARVASKITTRPNRRILLDNVSSTHTDETDKNEVDLYNSLGDVKIKHTSDLDPLKDTMNVQTFITKHKKSILFYKRQNETDIKYKVLQLDDFVIVMMTPFQEEMLIKYGHKIIAVDETFGLNRHEFILHTFLVIDNFHVGIPIAFIISNRNDDILINIALESIKDKVDVLRPMTFMSDMRLTYINSWERIMAPVKFHLFCNWHVFEEWNENFGKIKNTDKKKCMRRRIYELAMCLDENTFEKQLKELLEDPDPDLKVFLIYFKTHYSKDTRSWAYCYCKHAFINTNAHCEAFNRNLRYFRGKNLEKTSLVDCLELLNSYLNTEECFLEIKAIKGKLPSKLKILRSRHDHLEKELEAEEVHVEVCNTEEGREWDVRIYEVKTDVENVYHVSKCDNYCDSKNCKLYCDKCDTCQYAYQCTCPDNMFKQYMCKHIHALCTMLKKEENALINQNTVDVYAEDIKFSHDLVQLNEDDDKELQTHVEDNLIYVYEDEELKVLVDEDILYVYDDDDLKVEVDVLYTHDDDKLPTNVGDDVLHIPKTEESSTKEMDIVNTIKLKAYDLFMKNYNEVKTIAEATILYNAVKRVQSQIDLHRSQIET